MCLTFKCDNCGKVDMHTYSEIQTVDREEVGKRLMRLATEPINPYWNWCTDCILDAPTNCFKPE